MRVKRQEPEPKGVELCVSRAFPLKIQHKVTEDQNGFVGCG